MGIDVKRRILLKGTLATGLAGVAVAAGILTPTMVLAAWPQAAFEAKSLDSAMNTLLGSSAAAESGDIKIKAPTIAENGAVVNIQVSSTIANAESISILVEKNATPLALSADLAANVAPFVKTRVKIGKTSKVMGVVKAGGKLYSASQQVKVTIGGCGG
jgi:sulfur-oxidizing protein SoxY